MDPFPLFPGPRLVPLLDGSLVFTDSREWAHLCEARVLAGLGQADREEWLSALDRSRGVEETNELRKTIQEIIAVTAEKGAPC